MSSLLLKMDGIAHRFEWLAWALLVGSLGLGLGQEIGAPPAGSSVGKGYPWWDMGMTTMVFSAAFVQGWVQIRFPSHGTMLERVARWLMFCVSTVFAFRFAWMIYSNGDIYAPPITVAAFTTYAVAQLMHCMAIIGLEKE